jgi:hypothetical protein
VKRLRREEVGEERSEHKHRIGLSVLESSAEKMCIQTLRSGILA